MPFTPKDDYDYYKKSAACFRFRFGPRIYVYVCFVAHYFRSLAGFVLDDDYDDDDDSNPKRLVPMLCNLLYPPRTRSLCCHLKVADVLESDSGDSLSDFRKRIAAKLSIESFS